MTISTQPEQDAAGFHFLNTSLDDLIGASSAAAAEAATLALFQQTAAEVPAYREFLALLDIDPTRITTIADFARLPLTTKPHYMQAYPLAQRCRGGSLLACDRVAVSSGSTGQPTFWPRAVTDEWGIAVRFEQVFRDSFKAHQRSTLAVVCFALGNWVGGLFTASCCWHLARKGYRLMVATPGNNKDEIFRIIRTLAPEFEQTVLLGYPPFVKDVIDAGIAEGIDWARCNVKMVFAGEVFSEEWRAALVKRAGSRAPCFDTASLYGTADGGVLGNETPFSIAARQFLAEHPAAARELFGESRLPTLVQYDPCSRYFETYENTLVVSGASGVPLVRYHIADRGGILSFARFRQFLADWGAPDLAMLGLPVDTVIRPLPLVYVFGRADFTVSFYGANIYPENVTVGLEQPDLMHTLTGKFVLEVQEGADGDRCLAVAIELKPGLAGGSGLALQVAESIRQQLLRLNSEFSHYVPPEKQMPQVSLFPFGDAHYFPAGVKHRYTRRSDT